MAVATRPKKLIHTKKRQGQHHHQGKHYIKTYLPYLPLLAIVGIGMVFNSVWSTGNVLGAQADYSQKVLLERTNQERSSQQESALTIDTQLTTAAQAKAEDMASRNYWAHNNPSGKTPWDFITDSGYQYQAAGENLAYGFATASDTITGWMNSTEHRANILNAEYQNVGFGVAEAPSYQGKGLQTIIVAEYGRPVPALATVTFQVPRHGTVAGLHQAKDLASLQVSRIQLLTNGHAAWSALVLSAVAGAAFAIFLVRHARRLHQMVFNGEAFIAHHPLLDALTVTLFTIGFILTRSGGVIR